MQKTFAKAMRILSTFLPFLTLFNPDSTLATLEVTDVSLDSVLDDLFSTALNLDSDWVDRCSTALNLASCFLSFASTCCINFCSSLNKSSEPASCLPALLPQLVTCWQNLSLEPVRNKKTWWPSLKKNPIHETICTFLAWKILGIKKGTMLKTQLFFFLF